MARKKLKKGRCRCKTNKKNGQKYCFKIVGKKHIVACKGGGKKKKR